MSERPKRSTRKRTSHNSDERKPTRSSGDKPSRKYRRPGEEPAAPAAKRASSPKVRSDGAPVRAPRPRKGRSVDQRKGRSADPRKRTSRNSDERNPTRSSVDYPSRKYRRTGEEPPAPPAKRASLRKVRTDAPPARAPRPRKGRSAVPPRKRRLKTTEASEELAQLAGRKAKGAQEQLARAAEAFTAGRERDAARLLRPLRDAYPDASAVRELMGLAHYRMGNFVAAAKELDAFVALTDSVEQHPVLMDCMRAMGKYRRVDELWEELSAASPSSALVTEGRIVLAGSRADRGKVRDAIALLARRGSEPRRVQDHHLRLWYALADLYERAGDIPKARDLFLRIRRNDAAFADVAERLAALR